MHEVGILEVVRTLKMMGDGPEIEIIGIVPEDISTMEMSLSAALESRCRRSFPDVLDAVS